MSRFTPFLRVPIDAGKAWVDHRCSSLGAALAYYGAFSLAPILVIAVSLSGLVFGREAVEGRVLGQLAGLLGADGASVLQRMIQASYLSGKSVQAALIGTLGILIGATAMVSELGAAFERIFSTERRYRNALIAFLLQRLRGLSVVIGLGFLLIVSLVASTAIVAASQYLTGWFASWVKLATALQSVLSIAFLSALFALMFRLLAPLRLSRQTLFGGALVTALLFEIGKWGVGLYLGAGALGSTFGAAGSFAVLLVWVYYVSLIVLYGAEITFQLHCLEARLAPARRSEKETLRPARATS